MRRSAGPRDLINHPEEVYYQPPSASASPRVLAVVVTHNGAAWLGNCLEGLAEQIYPNLDVVVADSASAENVAESFGDMLPDAEFVRVERNVGFGAAANAALEVSSRAREADFFLFLHDDVELEPETLSLMVATALETDAGIVGAKGVEWDRPEVLVEVGMSADQFGYPYSGLDPGEIDQGQHDVQKEVLYVTSACMLVSRSFVERCGLWDAGYFAFGEDLDLCTRARLAGFRVMVQPGARFRHAEALSNERRHVRAIASNRFLTRRNRLRTITKNVALYRMLPIMALYLGLSVAEVFMLIFFRRFEQIGEYPKALASYLVSLPDVLRRRRAVQKRRVIPDRRLRRLMVSDTDRARVFLERRLRAWEKGTIALGARTLSHLTPAAIKKSLAVWIRRPTTAAGALIFVALIVAMRKILIGDQLAAGSLWPFPDSPAGAFLGDYLAAWRDVGLGTESASPPAFAVMWLVSVLGFGSPGFAQKLLMAFLIGAGLAGAYRFVALRAGSRAARMLSVGLYALGPVTHSAVSGGDLGALGLFAALPYMFEIALRMLGLRQDFRLEAPAKRSGRRSARRAAEPQSPAVHSEALEGIEAFPAQMLAASGPGGGVDDPAVARRPEAMVSEPISRDVLITQAARLGLVTALVVALGPSSLVVVLAMWTVMSLVKLGHQSPGSGPVESRQSWLRIGMLFASAGIALAVLLPWSLEALRPSGAILAPLFSGLGGVFSSPWREHGIADILLMGESRALATLVSLAVAAGVLVLPGAARRFEARILMTLWLAFGVGGALAVAGLIPAPVASPQMWLMVSLAVLSCLGGHLVAGLREELPRHHFGWRHQIAVPAVAAVAVVGFITAWLPPLGNWGRSPQAFAAGLGDEEAASIGSFLKSTAEQSGNFRVLWLGDRWLDPIRAGSPRIQGPPYLITGSSGLDMQEAFRPPPSKGDRRLEDAIGSLVGQRVHLAGHLLAPAGIRFVVADAGDVASISALRIQRDMALEQQQGSIALFRNLQWLPRAVLAPATLTPKVAASGDETGLMLTRWSGGREIPQRGQAEFSLRLPRTLHSQILLGDNFNESWRAKASGVRLKHLPAFGWANRFVLSSANQGEVRVYFGTRWLRFAWLAMQALIFLIVAAVALARRRETLGRLR